MKKAKSKGRPADFNRDSHLIKNINHIIIFMFVLAQHINLFLDIGVPDWRLDKLPELYQQLLLQKEILLSDGLTEIELNALVALSPIVAKLCQKLSAYSIPQSVVQCDFHDNNILIESETQRITFIDLGEIVISHPFFSLVGCLRQAKIHHGLRVEDNQYNELINACYENFNLYGSRLQIINAFSLAQLLWFVYEAISQYRLRNACDINRFLTFQQHGKLSGRLKEFILACAENADYGA